MKRTLTVTCLLAGIYTVVSLESAVQAQNRQERRARAPFVRATQPVSESAASKVQRGLDSAPVPLNLDGKDIGLIGLGSYIVNIEAGCNGCHSTGPATTYAPGGNPYFGQPKVVNKAVYLRAGRDFDVFIPASAHIISGNLT